jgi:hypothetical protein
MAKKAPPGYFYNKRGALTKKLPLAVINAIKKRFPNKKLDFDLFKYGVDDFDKNYDQIRNMDPDRIVRTKLRRAKPEYKEGRRLRAKDYYTEQRENILQRAKDRYRSDTPVGKTGKTLKELTKEKNLLGLVKYQTEIGVFPTGYTTSGGKGFYKPELSLWRDLYRSAIAQGQTRWTLPDKYKNNVPVNDLGKKAWGQDNYYKKIKFIDNKTGETIKLDETIKGKGKTLKQYLNTTIAKETGKKNIYKNALNSYDLKNKIGDTEFKYRGSKERLGTVLRDVASKKSGTNIFNALEVHHPAGVKVNWWENEVTFRDANRNLQSLSKRLERDFAKATTTLEKNKLLKEVGKKVDKLPGGISYIFEGEKIGTTVPTAKSVIEGAAQTYKDPALTRSINLLLTAAKTNKGGVCNIFRAGGGRIGFAAGSSCVAEMGTALKTDPIRTTEQISKLPGEATGLTKIRGAATNFLKILGKGGARAAPLAALAAVGAGIEPLVKQFVADDPSTYLTDENQMKGMLLATIEGEKPKVDEEILKWQLPALGAATAAGAIPGAREAYRARRGVGPTGPLPEGVGKVRAALGIKGVLGKALGASFSPLAVAATLPMDIAAQRKGGTEWGDIATDPLHWMAPAFASSGAAMATAGMKPTGILAKAIRMGISPRVLQAVSRRFGMPGLAISAGMWGYDKWKNRSINDED